MLAGWTTTEAGRQPWTVYGLMRTADSVTPSLTTADVSLSLALYVLSYLFIFGAGGVLLARLVRLGPDAHPPGPQTLNRRAARPLSAVQHSDGEESKAPAYTEVRGGDDDAA